MKHWLPLVIALLALIGLVDSTYLTLAHYGVVSRESIETSGICQLTSGSCVGVILSPQASIAGIPHAVLGAAYFVVLLTAAVVRMVIGRWFAPWEMLGFLILGLAFSAYLTQELILRMHIPCPFCLTAHAINGVVVALYAISVQP